MSCNNPIFVDDIGTTIRVTVQECIDDVLTVVDVSGQSAMSFFFKKPDDSVVTETPVFTDDGVDGQIEHTFLVGEVDQIGTWSIQAEVTLPSGTWRTTIDSFEVREKLS
jgi:hypothetical protein